MDRIRPDLMVFLAFAVWVGMLHILARLGGWASLAEAYQLSGSFEGERWRFQSAQLRWRVNYGNILTVGANGRGLYLAVFLLFRIAHPPLFIPWTDIFVRVQKGRLATYVELGFRRAPGVPFRVSERLGRLIAASAGLGWPGERAPLG